MIDERHHSVAQTLSGAIGTSVTIYEGGHRVFSTPDEVRTVEGIVFHRDFYSGLELDNGTVNYVENKYNEHYIVLRENEQVDVVIGPFCTERMTGLGVSALVRETGLPPRSRSKLLDHFMALPVFTISQNHYLGQLLLALFFNVEKLDVPDQGRMKNFPGNEFNAQRVQNRVSQYAHPPYFLEQELVRAISAGDKSAAYAVLGELDSANPPRLADSELRSEQNLQICNCATFARAAIKGGTSSEDAFTLSDVYINRIEVSTSIEEIRATRDEMAEAFIDLVRSVKVRNYSAPISETVQYIKAHLNEKLTLPDLAELVHLHPNYLSSVFKRETGESVTTYILRQRIYEAAHMLQTTDMSASEISSFYLFCNQSYFIKTFRRFMGCSPQQYREQCANLKHDLAD